MMDIRRLALPPASPSVAKQMDHPSCNRWSEAGGGRCHAEAKITAAASVCSRRAASFHCLKGIKSSEVCATLLTGHSSPEVHWTNMPVKGREFVQLWKWSGTNVPLLSFAHVFLFMQTSPVCFRTWGVQTDPHATGRASASPWWSSWPSCLWSSSPSSCSRLVRWVTGRQADREWRAFWTNPVAASQLSENFDREQKETAAEF